MAVTEPTPSPVRRKGDRLRIAARDDVVHGVDPSEELRIVAWSAGAGGVAELGPDHRA